MNQFLWERRRHFGVYELTALLALLVTLDYDIGNAMTSGLLPLIQNYGKPW